MPQIPVIPIKDRFQWGPIPAVPYYLILVGLKMVFETHRKYGIGWPEGLLFFYNADKCLWYGRQKETDNNGIRAADLVYGKNCRLSFVRSRYLKYRAELKKEREKILQKGLKYLSGKELLNYYQKFIALYENFWQMAIYPELIGYGTGAYLSKYVPKFFSESQINDILAVLTSVNDFTFFQKEEVALLKIIKKINISSGQIKKLKNQKAFRAWLIKKYPEVHELVKAHTLEYNWLLNNYSTGEPLKDSYFYDRICEFLRVSKNTSLELRKIKKQFKQTKDKRDQIIQNLSQGKLKFYASICGDAVAWHDDRKSWQLRSQTVLHYFLQEFSKRHKVKFDDLLYLLPEELEKFLQGKIKLPKKKINIRRKLFLAHIKPTSIKILSGKEVKKVFDQYRRSLVIKDVDEIKGVVASSGKKPKIKGRVKILQTPKDSSKMKKGDILVAELTSPDYIIAIRKAGAIITDAGGLTSHAAVVARELGIICVVNTKIGTRVLKDGDLVEVDANKGTVVKLKK
ncbi:MAG: PEP-utilizing enzyme [Candidatus Kuenenbacteria bacterium]